MKTTQTSTGFQDYFSAQAESYARYRPHYPKALFAWLASLSPHQQRAWDCATGSGQAAVALAAHFDEVIGTEPSVEQLTHAVPHPKVSYQRSTAEQSGLDAHSMDLVCAAAAAHWFDHPQFHKEVRRVTRPDAVVAIFSYSTVVRVSPAIDALINRWADVELEAFWPERFALVRQRYETIPFPFAEIPFGDFACKARWSQHAVVGVFSTWSATQRLLAERGDQVIHRFAAELNEVWPNDAAHLDVEIPLFGRVGRVTSL